MSSSRKYVKTAPAQIGTTSGGARITGRVCPSCNGRRGHHRPSIRDAIFSMGFTLLTGESDVWIACRACNGYGAVDLQFEISEGGNNG